MTWCLSHISEEQALKVMEKANKDGIHIYEIHQSIKPEVVLIHTEQGIVMANSDGVNQTMNEAMRG